MYPFIEHINIDNFKSIRHLELNGLKRINLFIGRPNVGKSNIIEAMSLFSIPYLWNNRRRKLKDIIRLENPLQLFYEGDYERGCSIRLKPVGENLKECCWVKFDRLKNQLHVDTYIARLNNSLNKNEYNADPYDSDYIVGDDYRVEFDFDMNIKGKSLGYFGTPSRDFISYVKPYVFKVDVSYKNIPISFLNPPFGDNILHILELNPELRKQYAQWFRQYGFRLVLDTTSQSLRVQKERGEDELFQLPYSSMADTLQRIIFYKTAVASNENSALLFEEPEAHAYPPYISEFTHEVVKSVTNQFFIVTHSPLIVEQFLTDAIEDLGIFMVDFKDGQTVVKSLSKDEIREVYRYGMDLFFNGDSYLV